MADAMDSKSISREGVGVRLPSLAPAPPVETRRAEALREVARDVGAVLWPTLGRELGSARSELENLLDELRRDPERLLRDESRLALQEHMGLRTNRTGWSLGVLAAAHGIDLLRERREPEGLRWIAGDLAEARGLVLVPVTEELPSVRSRVCREWEVCLLAAWCVQVVGDGSDGA